MNIDRQLDKYNDIMSLVDRQISNGILDESHKDVIGMCAKSVLDIFTKLDYEKAEYVVDVKLMELEKQVIDHEKNFNKNQLKIDYGGKSSRKST